jgi:hypothetical protein
MTFRPRTLVRAVQDHAHWLTSWPVFALFLFGLCLWCAVDVRVRGYPYADQPDEHKTDLTVYTEAGAAFFDGRKPYQVSNIRGWVYMYPPLFGILMAPLHALQTQDQVTVWFFISVLFLWGVYREIGRIVQCLCAENTAAAAWWRKTYPWPGVAAFCAAFLPTLNCLQRGQVGVLMLYLLLLGFRLIVAPGSTVKRLLGGIVLSLPIVLKLMPALPVGLLLFVLAAAWLRPRWQRAEKTPQAAGAFFPATLGVALGGFLFFLVVPAAFVGWNANLHHLQTWGHVMASNAEDGGVALNSGNSQTARNQSLNNAVTRLGNFAYHCAAAAPDDRLVEYYKRPPMPMDTPAIAAVLLGVRLAIILALLLTAWRLARQGDGLSLAAALSLGCAAILVISPVARGHYFMLYVPGIFFVPWFLRCRDGWRKAWLFAAAPIVMIDLHYFILPISGRIGLLGLGTTVWLLAAMIAVGRCTAASPALSLSQLSPAALSAGKKAA